jgi:cytochrome c553
MAMIGPALMRVIVAVRHGSTTFGPMKRRSLFLIPLVILAILGCFAAPGELRPLAAPLTADGGQDLKPASELALMMRVMAVHADSVKAALRRGDRRLPPAPAGIERLLEATPTEGMHIDPITFPTFGKDYQDKVEALYKAARKDRAQAYNALVQSCANCHGSHCPGPLMRIKKMYLKGA